MLGSFQGSCRAPLKEFGVDIRQVLSRSLQELYDGEV